VFLALVWGNPALFVSTAELFTLPHAFKLVIKYTKVSKVDLNLIEIVTSYV